MTRIGSSIKGKYRDILRAGDGRLIHDSDWVSNTIVNQCRVLLAGFVRNDPSDGIQFLAVGQGEAIWDTAGAPASDPQTTVNLVTPFQPPIPASDLAVDYLDETDTVVAGPTSRLQITATLAPGYPTPLAPLTTYPLREFGLFGRLNGVDFMINSIRHPVIHKDEAASLIRVVRLYF